MKLDVFQPNESLPLYYVNRHSDGDSRDYLNGSSLSSRQGLVTPLQEYCCRAKPEGNI